MTIRKGFHCPKMTDMRDRTTLYITLTTDMNFGQSELFGTIIGVIFRLNCGVALSCQVLRIISAEVARFGMRESRKDASHT